MPFCKNTYFLILFNIFFLCSVSAQNPEDTAKHIPVGTSGTYFKTGSGTVLGTAKWVFPAIAIATGGGYFYFDSKADDNYQKYLDANSRNAATDYRTKTKDNDQIANICGISAIASTLISVAAWLLDTDNSPEQGENYKFILVSGRQLLGYIIREDFDSFLIQTKEGAITVKRGEISRIEKEGLIIFEK